MKSSIMTNRRRRAILHLAYRHKTLNLLATSGLIFPLRISKHRL